MVLEKKERKKIVAHPYKKACKGKYLSVWRWAPKNTKVRDVDPEYDVLTGAVNFFG